MVSGVAGLLKVDIRRQDPGTSGDLTCQTSGCRAGTGPHGERYRTTTSRDGSGAVTEREVVVLRPDGSWVAATLSAVGPRGLPLTAAQQQAVAFDPTVALP
jgi:hypothetical protein